MPLSSLPPPPAALGAPAVPPVGITLPPPPSPKATRDERGRWLPGYGPNPRGRPVAFAQLKKDIQESTAFHLWRLQTIVEDDAQPGTTHIAAIQLLWAYGYGKPTQKVEVGGPGSFEQMDDDELRRYVRQQAVKMIEGEVMSRG